jgi:hypothetical protein
MCMLQPFLVAHSCVRMLLHTRVIDVSACSGDVEFLTLVFPIHCLVCVV